jgi:hypothetical protein
MSALYGPQVGAATFLLIDFATGIVFSIGVWRQAVWREVVPLVVCRGVRGAIRHADPALRRSGVAALADGRRRAAWCVVLGSGWRYHGRPLLVSRSSSGSRPARSAAPRRSPARRWCCSGSPAWRAPPTARANFIVFFAIFAAALVATYLATGLFTAKCSRSGS